MAKKKQKLDEHMLSIVGGFVNPTNNFHHYKLSNIAEEFVAEEDGPKYDLKEFQEEVAGYNEIGKMIYRENDIRETAQKLAKMCEIAKHHSLNNVDEAFDKITINKNMKTLGNHAKEFTKIAGDAASVQQRMESLYEDMGHILGRYYNINEAEVSENSDTDVRAIGKKIKENDGKYEEFFRSAMQKFGISSPDELEDEKKKKFYNYVDKNYQAKTEGKLHEASKFSMGSDDDLTDEDRELASQDHIERKLKGKKIGEWEFGYDQMSGAWEWSRDSDDTLIYATLFWDGDGSGLPINVIDDGGDYDDKFKPNFVKYTTKGANEDLKFYLKTMKKVLKDASRRY
jgi:hypothetical protein